MGNHEILLMGSDVETVEGLLEAGRSVSYVFDFGNPGTDWEKIIQLSRDNRNLRVSDSFERTNRQKLNLASNFITFAGYRMALDQLNGILEREPDNAQALGLKGIALFYEEDLNGAIFCMEAVRKQNPQLVEEGLFYNDLLFLKKKYASDEIGLKRHIACEIQHELARAYKSMSRYDEALACYDRSLQIDPQNTASFSMKGGLLLSLGYKQEAMACFRKSLEIPIDPNCRLNCFDRGLAFHMLERYDEAVVWYQKALAIEPYYNLAERNLVNAQRRIR